MRGNLSLEKLKLSWGKPLVFVMPWLLLCTFSFCHKDDKMSYMIKADRPPLFSQMMIAANGVHLSMNVEQFQAIKNLFPSNVFKKGFTYYKEGKVFSLSYNRQLGEWFAEVEGTFPYYVEIKVEDLFSGEMEAFCDCPAFATYGTCKHIAAVLLEMAEQGVLATNRTDERVFERFIEDMYDLKERKRTDVFEKVPMQVEYVLIIDEFGKLYLELKTGIRHRYVVKNVPEFLHEVLNGKGCYFTKKFSYDPGQHYFLQQDWEIFSLLHATIQTNEFFKENNLHDIAFHEQRKVVIPPLVFGNLLEKLKQRDVKVAATDETKEGIDVIYGKIPSSFTLSYDKDNRLTLTIDSNERVSFLKMYKALYADGVFFIPNDEQWFVCESIWQLGIHHKGLVISDRQKNAFFSEVVPLLKEVADVQVDEIVKGEVVEYPLRATLHLEDKDGLIQGKLAYHYGSYTFDPFLPDETTEQIVIRDAAKEDAIMQLIEQSNFKYNGDYLYIHLEEDEDVYEFLYVMLPKLAEKVELYLTPAIKRLIVEQEPTPRTNVAFDEDTNLLSIHFDISDVDEDEVIAMLQSVVEKKRFYRMKSGALVSLENDAFRSLRTLFAELGAKKEDVVNGELKVPVFRGLEVDEIIETEKRYEPSFRKLLHRLKSPEEQVYEVPEKLNATLRPYQEIGYQWFKSLSEYHLGGILADDMGLGKTVQAIAYLLSEESGWPHLVVAPSSVVYNWRNEFHKFAPHLKVAVIAGPKHERQQAIKENGKADVWITSYGTLRQDIALYQGRRFHTLILDEAQYIKNYATKTSQAIRRLVAQNRFALTGTPIENSLQELWAIFQVILPGLLPPLQKFNQLSPEKVSNIVKPFILRRVKEDVLKELPEKIESVHLTELTEEQKMLYLGYLRKLQQETAQALADNRFQENRMKILAGLTRLRQICCHPSLFLENYEGRSGKLDQLMETVQTLMQNGRRMLIFSQFTSMHELIRKELETLNIDYYYLHGQTPAEERVQMSEAFNNGEKNVFLISLRAGGTGLNLTGADTVILFDLWWNPAVEDQAAARAHRFGQKNVVQVIRFITEGTIEERIYELQQKKRELVDRVIQPEETLITRLSEADIRALLNL